MLNIIGILFIEVSIASGAFDLEDNPHGTS
jgi:hypothetical protein